MPCSGCSALHRVNPNFKKMELAKNGHKKQDIHRRKLHVQYRCPTEYNISNSYCYKELQLRNSQVEQPGTIWHQEQTDTRQKKLTK